MKKYLSVIAIVALFAFAVASVSSCKKAKKDDPKEEMDSYSYSATLSDDALSLFDVTITCTKGSTSETFALTTAGTVQGVSGKSTGTKAFTVSTGTAVSVTATVTPKSNWASVAAAKGDNSLNIFCTVSKLTPNSTATSTKTVGGSVKGSNVSQNTVDSQAKSIASALKL